jgi:hypothetical protein
MQLSFMEFLYISAKPLHKVKTAKRNPIEGYAVSACLARKWEKLVSAQIGVCCPPRPP